MPLSFVKKMNVPNLPLKSLFSKPAWIWSEDIPDRMIVKPVDPWPATQKSGRGVFELANLEALLSDMKPGEWPNFQQNEPVFNEWHSFSWLRNLRQCRNEKICGNVQALIIEWAERHAKPDRIFWQPGLTGSRIAMWIAHYDHFSLGADEYFQDRFFKSLLDQAKYLSRDIPKNLYGLDLLKACKGLLYAGLALEGREEWVFQAMHVFEQEVNAQILPDGSHISRNPSLLLDALQIFLDVRMALAAGGYPMSEKIQHGIDRMGPAVRFFRFADKAFSLMNGAQECEPGLIDSILGQANARGKPLQTLPYSGYERINQGRTQIIWDRGICLSPSYREQAHAAPLSFEMAYGKDRIFVSCGQHPYCPEWQEALKAGAAHNTLTIENRNADIMYMNKRTYRQVESERSFSRRDKKDAVFLEASHDGYLRSAGLKHQRFLYLTSKGEDFRGEDRLISLAGRTENREFCIRFHLHPRVLVSLVRNKTEALLRLPNGIGWRFYQSGGAFRLEDSIYLGTGNKPRKTKQLAIYGYMSDETAQVKWALKREGL